MDFFTGQELIGACKEKALPISEIIFHLKKLIRS